MNCFVYKWTELSTNKWYIGSRTAKSCHIDDGYLCSSKIVKPLIKSNPENWTREIIANGNVKNILNFEHVVLTALDAAEDDMSYNRCNAWPASLKCRAPSDETKAKIRKSLKGRKRSRKTKDSLKKAWVRRRANGTDKHTTEAKAKMSAAQLGNKHSLGRTQSAETRAKIGAAGKGRIVSAATRAKASASNKGQKCTAETKAKMSVSARNKPPITDVTRAKLKASQQARRAREKALKETT